MIIKQVNLSNECLELSGYSHEFLLLVSLISSQIIIVRVLFNIKL